MLTLPVVRLKKGREKPARAGHPWVFSGALEAIPAVEPGSWCRVEDAAGKLVAIGYVHPQRSLALRLLSWTEIDSIEQLLRDRLRAAIALRSEAMPPDTDALRLVNSEGDFLPGLIVDRYADVLVVQILTAGMELRRDAIVAALVELLAPRTVFERSDVPIRRDEDLPMRQGVLWGEPPGDGVWIREHGLRFRVQPDRGQKTGFFLDQRDNRARVRQRTAQRQAPRVLNCFAYTGGFSIAALAAGAAHVCSVESSQAALDLLRENAAANGLAAGEVVHADAFDFLRQRVSASERYDLVILDPPAFAKKKHQVEPARRGYKEINLQALQLLRPGGELFTFSCSQYFDEPSFRQTLFTAANDAGVRVQILERFGHAWDHPLNLSHLEGEYLKGFHLRRA
jgi:23S rRNA (cytosine1962-C5)-methyltransferase